MIAIYVVIQLYVMIYLCVISCVSMFKPGFRLTSKPMTIDIHAPSYIYYSGSWDSVNPFDNCIVFHDKAAPSVGPAVNKSKEF